MCRSLKSFDYNSYTFKKNLWLFFLLFEIYIIHNDCLKFVYRLFSAFFRHENIFVRMMIILPFNKNC